MESKSYAALDLETLAALDPNTSYAKIREMVGSGKRVLDVGCGPGNLAAILTRTGNAVVGIDRDEVALAYAQRVCERTIAADLDSAQLDELVGDERFDVVVFADVLEHLRDPVKLLGSSRRVLRDSGCVIVSIPNVAHAAVRLALLRGRFEYQQLGILDDTHIRFYTRESVLRLLSESALAAVRIDRTTASVFERSDLVPLVRREDYDAALIDEILRDEDAETLQFVVRAAPVGEGQVAAVLTAEITSLQQAVRMLRAQLAQANDATSAAVAHTNGVNGAHSVIERLTEVESHYRNALDLAETTRAERDAALAAGARAAAELEEANAELARAGEELAGRERALAEAAARENVLAEAADRANAELEAYRAELTARDAAAAASAGELALREAALQDARANYELAVGTLEPLRAELARVQRLADTLAAQRDAAIARIADVEADLLRANTSAAAANDDIATARALLAQAERELLEARAERDEALAGRAESAALQDAVAAQRALARRASDLESLLAVERTSREHVEEASDRLLGVARDRDTRAAESELRRLLACSTVVDMELRFAKAASRRAPLTPVPPAVSMPPALVLQAEKVGRRTLTLLPPSPAGRREWLRVKLYQLRQVLRRATG